MAAPLSTSPESTEIAALRAMVADQQAQIDALHRTLADRLRALEATYEARFAAVLEALRLERAKRFGASSERNEAQYAS
ncbi:MAG: hypothetical protein V2J02_01525 [Pseudomonadales bacterium]|jgi:hypothetical protein|nr:hypothetical protein [Pseudomonadales bacterium]